VTQRGVSAPDREVGAALAAEPRPLRRDAEVNLSRILAAARDVFAEEGYDASMEAIAVRAEVGVGTLYRRFPHKADLLNAVVAAAHERNRQIAEAVLADVPPEDGVFEFLRRCIAYPSCWRATISAPPWRSEGTGLDKLAPLLREILTRSQRAGAVRSDIDVADIVMVLMSVRAIADVCNTKSSKPSLRFLELLLDGLRPGHDPVAQDPLTIAQLDRILRRR
jgi:AcrR family transcriptional regulator